MTLAANPLDTLGQPLKRKEDPRFITGTGRYLDDITLPGMTHLVVLRSPYAHARIRSINTSVAKTMPGVVAVYTGADTAEVNPLPCAWAAGGVENHLDTPRILTPDVARWTGDAVAAVVAETRAQAVDAAAAIDVDYEPLPVVVNAEEALKPGAPQLHENAPSNIEAQWSCGDAAGTAQAIGSAEVVVRQRIVNQRLIPNPMETRGSIGSFDAGTGEYTVWMTSQAPHVMRLLITAFVLGIPEHKMRCISPDVGGGFGSKIFLYHDMPLVAWISKQLGRPVKFVETRSENYQATTHGRDHITDIEVAGSRDGVITGLRVKTIANMGAYLSTIAPGIPTTLYGRLLSGAYRFPNIFCEVTNVYTNTAMVDAYRGAGRPEATYVVERAIDLFADEIGMDPAEVRRRNFIPPDAFPYDPKVLTGPTGLTLKYDSGNYAPALDRALEMAGYADQATAKAEAASRGKLLGFGLSSYIEICGVAPSKWIGLPGEGWGAGLWESANIRVHLTGKVVVTTGSQNHGQGHETTMAQIVGARLGIPVEDVLVEHSDTSGTPFGYGTYGSRSGAVGGIAAYNAAEKVRDKAKRLAAHMLEANPEDMEYDDGTAFVRGSPDRAKTIAEIALAASVGYDLPAGMEPFLDETAYYDPPNCTYPFGTHVAMVEVDRETGHVDLVRYIGVDDVGKKINPLVVDGQLHGGIAQGVGQALWEGAVYDDSGQLLSGTMMDYALPRASRLPSFELDETVTPSPVNPLGIKGAGEAGTIGSAAAVVNAVVDALSDFGIRHIDMPLTDQTVWRAMRVAEAGGAGGDVRGAAEGRA
ncbi:MAG: molybdopterin-dependent oxidoreductase [Chloroflexi bacterium]|nr:molybdopterin-dependent oxidoreductase [Chloroflexota bacterium]